MNIFKFIVVAIGVFVLFGCQDPVQRRLKADAVSINDSHKLSVADSIYFISSSTSSNIITVSSDVPDANLYFAVNQGPFERSTKASLILQEQDSILRYYLVKGGFDNSATKTVVFPKHSRRFLDKVAFSAILPDSTLTIDIMDKSRGILSLEIYTLMGSKLLARSHSKNTDNLSIRYALENYPPGIYLAVLRYGQDLKTYRMLQR